MWTLSLKRERERESNLCQRDNVLLAVSFLWSDAECFSFARDPLGFFPVNDRVPWTAPNTVLWAMPVSPTLIPILALETNHSMRKRSLFFMMNFLDARVVWILKAPVSSCSFDLSASASL